MLSPMEQRTAAENDRRLGLGSPSSVWRSRIGLGVLLLGLAVAALAARAVVSYNSDDSHFAMAAQLVAEGHTPYLDFPFFQTPYAPYIYAAALAAQLSPYKYLSLRLVNLLFCLASIAIVYFACKKISGNDRVALAGTLLFASSEYLNQAAEQLNSYGIANLFAVLSFTILVVAHRRVGLSALLSGLCLGGAIGSKLYYVVLAPPLLVFASTAATPCSPRISLRLGGAWLVGLGFGLAPAGLLALRDATVFWFDNYGYHLLNAEWRESTNFERGMSIPGKLKFLTQVLATPVFLATAILGYFLYSRVRSDAPFQFTRVAHREVRIFLLAFASVAVTFAAAMIPRPLWASYFLAPLPFSVFVLASLYKVINEAPSLKPQPWDTHMLNVALIVCALTIPVNVHAVRRAMNVDAWSTVAIHKQGQSIRRELVRHGPVGTLMTFETLFAIEGGFPLYKETAGGVFGYRVGDLMPSDLRARCGILSPATIGRFLDTHPHLGILIGTRFPAFDKDLLAYAASRGYRESGLKIPEHRLFAAASDGRAR